MEQLAKKMIQQKAKDFLWENYLPFSHYTIQSRAITREEDGLKPVQRRILYQLWTMGKTSDSSTVKAQKVCGDVSGSLSPHGDCLHKDTLFLLADGRAMTIKEMYEESKEKNQTEFSALSVDKRGTLVFSKICHVRIGQWAKELYILSLSNGEKIIATSNHPFLLKNLSYVSAKDLKIGDEFLTFEDSKVGPLKSSDNLFLEKIEIQEQETSEPMYDFSVEKFHNALIGFQNRPEIIVAHNSSVAGAVARMGQTFSLRVPLISVLGSVGFVSGDKPASPRYYEIKLSKAAEELVKELPMDAVPMVDNYDGTRLEPTFLPARFPNFLINGTSGIAVGFASNAFSHNPSEVMDACIAFCQNSEKMTVDELLQIMPGPDLPTGGIIYGKDGIRSYYETGRGEFTVRGRYREESLGRGRKNLIFYELPYQIPAEKIMTEIREGQDTGLFSEISEVKDLTDMKSGLQLVITLKSGADMNKVLYELYEKTSITTKFYVNNVILQKGKPVTLSVLDLISSFVNLRKEIITKKTEFQIKKIDGDLLKTEALLKISLDIDKAIKIIREAKNRDVAKLELMKAFELSSEGADEVLKVRLYQLTQSDHLELEKKEKGLLLEKKKAEAILKTKASLNKEVIRELNETKEIIKDERRSLLSPHDLEEAHEELEKKALVAQVKKGQPRYYTLLKGENNSIEKSTERLSKKLSRPVILTTQDNVLGITKKGLVDIFQENTPNFMGVFRRDQLPEEGVLLVTSLGGVNIVKGGIKTQAGMIKLSDQEELVFVRQLSKEEIKEDSLLMLSSSGKICRFPLSLIRQSMFGAGPIVGMKLKEDEAEQIVASDIIKEGDFILSSDSEDKVWRLISEKEIPIKGRAVQGMAFSRLRKADLPQTKLYIVPKGEEESFSSFLPVEKRTDRGKDIENSQSKKIKELF